MLVVFAETVPSAGSFRLWTDEARTISTKTGAANWEENPRRGFNSALLLKEEFK